MHVPYLISQLYISSLTVSLPLLYACTHDTFFNTCLSIQIYRYTCACLCTPLGIYHTTRWEVLTPLNLHVQILDLGPWWTSWWSESHSDSVMDQQLTIHSHILPGTPTRLSSFPFVTHEHILYCSYSYISLYSHIYAYRWCNILVILCHVLW